jgi:two-component system sensor histidine kinase PhoQ
LPSRAPTATTNNPVPPRRPLSLAARAAIATGFALAAFLGIVGLTLSQAQ